MLRSLVQKFERLDLVLAPVDARLLWTVDPHAAMWAPALVAVGSELRSAGVAVHFSSTAVDLYVLHGLQWISCHLLPRQFPHYAVVGGGHRSAANLRNVSLRTKILLTVGVPLPRFST